MFRHLSAAVAMFIAVLCPLGQAQSLSTSQTLQITIQPAGEIVSATSATLVLGAAAFGTFSGSITISDKIRTSPSGSGTITLQFSTDFSGSGPKIASGDLTFQCISASYGTACSGTITPVLNNSRTVNTFGASACTGGGGACSSSSSNTLTLTFSIPDRVSFKTGTYSTSALLTISSL